MDVQAFRIRFSTLVVGAGVALVSLLSAGVASADEPEDVENFEYASWNLNYDISLDANSRAQAEVTEELQVEFPQTDQNRGIVRSLPLRYQSAPAAPEDISVTDGAGDEVPFEVEDEDGFRNILVGDDTFVHGTQTYVISYTVDDVMHATDQADEFYWDVVPVDRQQPIEDVTAQIRLDSTLSAAMTGNSSCYVGTPDDSASCSIETTGDGALSVSETQLPPGQGVTVAIGVEPGTVTQPPERQENVLLDVVPLLLVGAAFLLTAGGALSVLAMVRRYRDDTSQPSTQYGIPEGMNPLIARWVTGRGHNPIVATILDLAVRGVLRIEEREEHTGKKPKMKPVLRLIDPQLATDPLERQLLEGIFPDLTPGETFTFPKDSKDFTKAAQKVVQDSGDAVLERGYQQKLRHRGAAVAGWVSPVFLIPALVLLIMGASRDNTVMTVLSVCLGLLSLMLMIICVVKHRVLTPRGAAERTQLERMRQMIDASETERLDILQSFTHASRRTAGPDSESQTIQLYDRLLPYAVLFGKEQEWSEVLFDTYQHYHVPAPIWYPALLHHGTDSLSPLSSMLSSVSAAAATSSSGAGSTGGGVAGGGGGGGAAGGR
ncbi:hypothetical protein GCM10009720_07580 [Yaniella flava]|uniref:DUF2207 domain-containing protein n=1 Tax=Yaniella flava TaxID=287930 RepID=A0ABP5FMM4_9MICC